MLRNKTKQFVFQLKIFTLQLKKWMEKPICGQIFIHFQFNTTPQELFLSSTMYILFIFIDHVLLLFLNHFKLQYYMQCEKKLQDYRKLLINRFYYTKKKCFSTFELCGFYNVVKLVISEIHCCCNTYLFGPFIKIVLYSQRVFLIHRESITTLITC